MTSFQLNCPHCGSQLSFAQALPAGTPVPCLICNRSFMATVARGAAPTARPVAAKPAAAAPAARPAAAPRSTGAATAGPAKPAAAPPRRAPAPTAAKPAPVAASGGLPGGALRRAAGAALAVAFFGVALVGGYFVWQALRPATAVVDPGPVAQVGSVKTDSDGPAKKEEKDPEVPPIMVLPPSNPKKPGEEQDLPPQNGSNDKAEKSDKDKKQGPKKDGTPGLVTPPPPAPVITVPVVPDNPVAGVDAKRVDAAIARGVDYLRRSPASTGDAAVTQRLGVTALTGLTLLECKVPANDPLVQKIAAAVRNGLASMEQNYELSLAVLFLDKLGQPGDRPLIQGAALRLVAAQLSTGGWAYDNKALPQADMQKLYEILHAYRPKVAKALKNPAEKLAPQDDPFRQLSQIMVPSFAAGAFGDPTKSAGGAIPNPNPPANPQPVANTLGFRNPNTPVASGGDNSNTQMALLALWAARRHEVPTEFSIHMAMRRFQATQNADGGWGYTARQISSPAMSGVGLIGLAMGYGTVAEVNKQKSTQALEDKQIQTALKTLAQNIGTPGADANGKPKMDNLYLLWTVERVAVLYDLKTIGGKDWYGWGAQMLLANQQADGSWRGLEFTFRSDHLDACFALLFLHRSNLAPDLTENLRLYMSVRDPGQK